MAGEADDCRDPHADDATWMGAMRDAGEIVGDIDSPASDLSDWDVLRPETAGSRHRRPEDIDGP